MCTICGRAVQAESSEELKYCPYDNIELHFEITEEEARRFGVIFPEHHAIEFPGDARFNYTDGSPMNALIGVRRLDAFQERVQLEASI